MSVDPGAGQRAETAPAETARAESACAQARRAALAAVRTAAALEAQAYGSVMLARAAVHEAFQDGTRGSADDAILELAGTARIGQGRAATQLSDGTRLRTVFPTVLTALQRGDIYRTSAELLLTLTRHCTDQVAAEIGRRVLDRLHHGTTTDQRRLIAETVLHVEAELDPDATYEREQAAAQRDNVWITPEPDSRCTVGANLDILTGRRWALAFDELVRAQAVHDRQHGLHRTRAQRRAAVFAELPSQVLTLLRAIHEGRLEDLLDLARHDPTAADDLHHLADTTTDLHTPEPPDAPDAPEAEPATEPAMGHDEADSEAAAAAGDGDPRPQEPASPTDRGCPDGFALAVRLLGLKLRDPRVLNVLVPLNTALNIDQRAGWVEGVGPISPFRVRLMLADTPLRRIVQDARTGQPQAWESELYPPPPPFDPTDPAAARGAAEHVRTQLLRLLEPTVITDLTTPGHDPTPAQTELVNLRDRTCTCPGCAMPAARSELDHERPYPQGPTATWNLSNKSARCHHAKHRGWHVHRDEHTGLSTWTSPLGNTYQRPGIWQPPPPLPDELPAPHLPTSPEVPVYDDRTWNHPLSTTLPADDNPPSDPTDPASPADDPEPSNPADKPEPPTTDPPTPNPWDEGAPF